MRISKFQQTPFVTHDNMNLLKIEVSDWDRCNPYGIEVLRDGETVFDGGVFNDRADLLIPSPQADGSYTVVLLPFEDLPVYTSFDLKVPEKLKVKFIYSSHEDIGYCAYENKLEYECYKDLLAAVELCEKYPDFLYVIEHAWWLSCFEKYASAEDCARLQAQFDNRKIELSASPAGVHTHWAEGEQLLRSLYFSTKKASERWHTEVQTAIYCDLSGITWSAVSAYAGQGVKYCTIFANGFRRGRGAGKMPAVFKWQAPNGKDSLLLWNQSGYRLGSLWRAWCDTNRQYKEGTFFFDESKALKTETAITDFIEGLGKSVYGTVPIAFYDDRETPTTMLLTVCDYMNKKWKSPEFSMGLPSDILGEIAEKHSDEIPVIAQDITDQWADFATISPEWTAAKRFAAHNALAAQTISTINAITSGTPYDSELFDKIIWKLCLFDEHCWATSSKQPQKMHRFNLKYVKEYSAMKAKSDVIGLISAGYGKPDGNIGIYNPLPQPRVSGLRINSGEAIPDGVLTQKLSDGTVITEPIAFGASEGKTFAAGTKAGDAKNVTSDVFETQYYKVTVNHKTQTICGVFDKQAQREVFSSDSGFGIGEYIYVVTEGKEDSTLHYELPKRRKFSVEEGPVAYTVTTETYEEQSGANIYTTVIFYKHENNIDFDIRFENAVGLMGDYYDRYKKNVFFSFPLKMNKTEYYTGLASGIVKESGDRLRVSPLDFSVAENWVAAEDDGTGYGVGIYSEDMAVFHFGDIKYNRFSGDMDFSRSNIFLYGASNRTNNLNYYCAEDCCGHYRISLLPYNGGCAEALPAWVREKVNRPIIGKANKKAFDFKIHDGGIRLLTFKKAEDAENAVILRVQDDEGKAHGGVRVTLPFNPLKAVATTINENELYPVETDGCDVIFPVDKYSYATVKIYGDFKIREADTREEQVHNVTVIGVENKRAIICFEKSDDCKAEELDIYGDGKLLCTVPNEILKTQTVELDFEPESVRIEPKSRKL